jgi:glycosyltransferase involved in cell wall biosynthesis
VNNLVSYPDVSGTIEVLRRLARDNEIPIDVPLHDYFSICPSFNLLDHRREFCHVPSVSRCRDCIRQIDLPLPARNAGRDIDAWRAAWARLLGEARRIICFSRSSIDLLARAHPGIDSARIELRPHVVDHMPKHTMALDRHAALHIGVVGEISYVKGAAVVAQLADELRRFGSAARLTVIGTVDKDHARAVPETGRYRPERLPELLAEHRVNVCLVPSVWPETYCYVVDELMELGMPVAAFDLGAPAERLRAYPLGIVLPSREPARILSDLETFWRSLRDGGRAAAGTELVS